VPKKPISFIKYAAVGNAITYQSVSPLVLHFHPLSMPYVSFQPNLVALNVIRVSA